MATALQEGATIFTNHYEPKEVSIKLNVKKELIGKDLEKDDFTFELRDEKGNLVQTAKNAKNGVIDFKEMKYKKVGTYRYTINELEGRDVGILYDKTTIPVKVEVVDNQGVLEATINYGTPPVFKNTYDPVDTRTSFKVRKELIGKELVSDEFQFELKDDSGKVLQRVSNDANGIINFEKIDFDTPDNYEYTITEVDDGQLGIVYDKHVIKVRVSVTDEQGYLVARVSYEGHLTFTNRYEPTPSKISFQVDKQLIGRELIAGEFEFELIDEDGYPIQQVSNNEIGHVNFEEITHDKVGTYRYIIQERQGNQPDILYDTHQVIIEVTVEDKSGILVSKAYYEGDKTFINHYQPTLPPVINEPNKEKPEVELPLTIKPSIAMPKKVTSKDELPKTNDVRDNYYLYMGMLIVMSVTYFVYRQRKAKIE